jgi:protein-L-isoaspartate(D-aspartate) O-methyltransferase
LNLAAADREARERAQFVLRLRQRGLSDLRVLRALERTPRSFFMAQRYADIAARDIALPIGGGQTAPPPSTVAQMIEALDVQSHHRVLEIGAGSGFATALLAALGAEVVALERSPTLAAEAAARLAAFGLKNVTVLHGDGLASDAVDGPFDRVLVHALIEPPAPRLTRWLAEGGALVAALADEDVQRVVRIVATPEGLQADAFGALRTLTPLSAGLMRAL